MAQVELKVIVNRQQLTELEASVNKLDGRTIRINAETSGLNNLANAANNANNATSQLNTTTQNFNQTNNFTNNTLNQTAVQFNQAVNSGNTYNTTINNITRTQQQMNEHTRQGGLLFDILGRSLSSFIARMTMYRAVYAGIAAITNGFRQAIETMKEVDKEMIAVKKVTGFSDTQMAAIENQSYQTASRYGTGAADYMASVADFARAGYMELAPALAELSVKTQIVGDTTAEVANQFLLSVDKAYKYQGSIEKLTAVLDGADIINNKYATSVERIAEGLGIVAPVASQMHVGVDELTAALGTITAVTQRSGSEAARALRALFLNIVGDTKTEIDEGVTWTTGEIAGLQDVIRKFAPEAYEYAKATQTIIDPMRAMEGLAKSMKEGLLNEQELMSMVSDIGGKLRTSQLLALIENWDMYESMLKDYQNAAGTADREVEMYMDSWEAKANQLKNTFTEFVRDAIDPAAIKKILDFLGDAIRYTDSLGGVLARLGIALVGLNLPRIITWFQGFFSTLAAGNATLSSTAGIIGVIVTALTVMYSIVSRMVSAWEEEKEAAMEAWRAENKAREEARQNAIEESKNSIEGNKARIASLEELRDEYLKITSSKYDEETQDALLVEWKNKLAEAYGVEKEALEGVNAERQTGLDLLDEEIRRELERAYTEGVVAYDEAQKIRDANYVQVFGQESGLLLWEQGESPDGNPIVPRPENLPDYVKYSTALTGQSISKDMAFYLAELYGLKNNYYEEISGNLYAGYGAGYYRNGLDIAVDPRAGNSFRFVGSYVEYIDLLQQGLKKLDDQRIKNGTLTEQETTAQAYLNAEYKAAVAAFEEAGGVVDSFMPTLAKYTLESIGLDTTGLKTKRDYTAAILEVAKALNEEKISEEDAAEITKWLIEQIGALTNRTKDSTDALDGETSALGENEAALEKDATAAEHAAAAKKDAEAAARKLIPALFDENGELTATAKEALAASSYLADLVQAELNAQREADQANYARLRAELAATGKDALRAMAALTAFYNMTRAASYAVQHGLELHAILPAMGPAMGILGQIAEVEAAMAAIDNQITAVSPYTSGYSSGSSSGSSVGSHGGSSSSSASTEDAKLKALQDRIKLLKSELSLMKERGDSEADQIAKMREIQKALENEWKYLQSIGGDQVTINNLMQEWYSIENQIADLKEKEADDAERQAEAIQKAVEAQLALNNALSNRNVRIYNAKTGQWEWVANPNDVASALKNYNDAVSGFSDADMAAYRAALAREMQNQSAFSGAETYAQTLTPILQALGATHNGNNYNFAGLTFSEAQARTLTLYDLAQMARNLAIA